MTSTDHDAAHASRTAAGCTTRRSRTSTPTSTSARSSAFGAGLAVIVVVCAIDRLGAVRRPRAAGGGARSADVAARRGRPGSCRRRRSCRPTSRPTLAKFRARGDEDARRLRLGRPDAAAWRTSRSTRPRSCSLQRGLAGAPGRGRCARRHACVRDGRSVGRTDDRRCRQGDRGRPQRQRRRRRQRLNR